jgi:hypothetical protein
MSPAAVTVESSAVLGIVVGGWYGRDATFRCSRCGRKAVISEAVRITKPLVFGSLSLLPLLNQAQFSALGLWLYLILLPGVCFFLVLRWTWDRRRFPELADARFVVSPAGTADERRGN